MVLDKHTIIEQHRTRVVYNWLEYFDAAGLKAELESCDFVVDEVLGDVAGSAFDPAS